MLIPLLRFHTLAQGYYYLYLSVQGQHLVIYHELSFLIIGLITHWTDDYTFDGLMYKLSKDEEYIILEVDTKEHFAFDVNKFRRMNNQNERFTYKEREFIFPMYKENIKEYRTTIRDFVKMKELEKLETKSDVQ